MVPPKISTHNDYHERVLNLLCPIYVKWSDWHHFPHYPATVMDIHVESRAANDVHITYHVRFDTDDHFNELPESEKMYQWLELDPDMAEWQYDNPNAPGT